MTCWEKRLIVWLRDGDVVEGRESEGMEYLR